MSETCVVILMLTQEYDAINPTINMAGMGCYSLSTIRLLWLFYQATRPVEYKPDLPIGAIPM
jgi:hypothetical protein